MSPKIRQKAELLSNKIDYFVEVTSKESVEGIVLFIDASYSQMLGGRDTERKTVMQKDLSNFDLRNSEPIQMAKMLKLINGYQKFDIEKG